MSQANTAVMLLCKLYEIVVLERNQIIISLPQNGQKLHACGCHEASIS
jgi:hypothetical protein